MSLVLRKGKEDIERINNLLATNNTSLSFLYRRQAQTDVDTELISNSFTESHIRASIIETQLNAEELQQKVKVYSIKKKPFL